jgi:hypothetical protein
MDDSASTGPAPGMHVARLLRRYMIPLRQGLVGLSETDNVCPKRTTSRISQKCTCPKRTMPMSEDPQLTLKTGAITSAHEIAKQNRASSEV